MRVLQIYLKILISYNQEGFPFEEDDSKITAGPAIADINDDGNVDILDVVQLVNIILNN